MAIRKGEYTVDKERLVDEDQYYATHGKKLIAVCNDGTTAKKVCEEHENGDGV